LVEHHVATRNDLRSSRPDRRPHFVEQARPGLGIRLPTCRLGDHRSRLRTNRQLRHVHLRYSDSETCYRPLPPSANFVLAIYTVAPPSTMSVAALMYAASSDLVRRRCTGSRASRIARPRLSSITAGACSAMRSAAEPDCSTRSLKSNDADPREVVDDTVAHPQPRKRKQGTGAVVDAARHLEPHSSPRH